MAITAMQESAVRSMGTTDMRNAPFGSTYYSDPAATYIVESKGEQCGNGIFGYYTSEFEAHAVRRWIEKSGGYARVSPYDGNIPPFKGNIHPFILETM